MDARRFLLFKVVAGTAVARIAAGEELVILRRRRCRLAACDDGDAAVFHGESSIGSSDVLD